MGRAEELQERVSAPPPMEATARYAYYVRLAISETLPPEPSALQRFRRINPPARDTTRVANYHGLVPAMQRAAATNTRQQLLDHAFSDDAGLVSWALNAEADLQLHNLAPNDANLRAHLMSPVLALIGARRCDPTSAAAPLTGELANAAAQVMWAVAEKPLPVALNRSLADRKHEDDLVELAKFLFQFQGPAHMARVDSLSAVTAARTERDPLYLGIAPRRVDDVAVAAWSLVEPLQRITALLGSDRAANTAKQIFADAARGIHTLGLHATLLLANAVLAKEPNAIVRNDLTEVLTKTGALPPLVVEVMLQSIEARHRHPEPSELLRASLEHISPQYGRGIDLPREASGKVQLTADAWAPSTDLGTLVMLSVVEHLDNGAMATALHTDQRLTDVGVTVVSHTAEQRQRVAKLVDSYIQSKNTSFGLIARVMTGECVGLLTMAILQTPTIYPENEEPTWSIRRRLITEFDQLGLNFYDEIRRFESSGTGIDARDPATKLLLSLQEPEALLPPTVSVVANRTSSDGGGLFPGQ